jgi:hypothetical protein
VLGSLVGFYVAVVMAAPAPPAWVAQQQCVAQPAADLACNADPVAGATPNDLAQCACDLLAAGGLTGCDELRDTGGRTLTIDRKLASAKTKSAHRQPQLIAAVGALAAMRVVSMTNQDFTVDAFNDRTLPRPVEETLHELPVAEMLFETAKTAFMLPTLETLVSARVKQATKAIPAATASCRRLLASLTKPQDTSPEAVRDDLICSLARTEPAAPTLAPRWPWCGGCDGEGSRALAFAMPATNVRYPAMFEQRARSLDRSRANTATQWACITTRERTPDFQFGNAPISLAVTSSLARFATLASLAASPYVVEEITLGDCAALRLDPLRQGAKLTLSQLASHARGNACDIERVRYATEDGKHIDIDFRADKLIPAFRDFTLDRGIRELYNDFAEQVRGEEPAADTKRDEVILQVLTRKALQDAGFVIFDPLLGLGHRGALHVEANPAAPFAATLGKGFDASQMADWLVGKALDPNHQPPASNTDHTAELNRIVREGASKRDIIDAERAKITVRGSSKDPIANLVTRDNRPWCASDNAVSVTLDFVEPAPAYELDVWANNDAGITVTADGKPWTQSGAHHFAAPERTPVRSLTVHAKSAKGRACLHFAVQGRHTGEAGKLRDLTIQRVTRTDDIPSLRPFIADLAQAIDECDGTTLADLAQLPLTIEVDQTPIKRVYRNARELARGCRNAELPRPSPELALTTDGLTASQHFEQWMVGSATWRYKAERGRWRLVGATAP